MTFELYNLLPGQQVRQLPGQEYYVDIRSETYSNIRLERDLEIR